MLFLIEIEFAYKKLYSKLEVRKEEEKWEEIKLKNGQQLYHLQANKARIARALNNFIRCYLFDRTNGINNNLCNSRKK